MARYGYRDMPSEGSPYPHTRKYEAEADTPSEVRSGAAYYPFLDIKVKMPAEVPLDDPKLEQYPTDVHDEIKEAGEGRLHADEVWDRSSQQTQTPQMFVPRPGIIDTAFGDKRMQIASGKLFGVIADDLKGHRMMASRDLSPHSARLVKKALEAGILEPNPMNPQGAVTNNFDFDDLGTRRGPTNFYSLSRGDGARDAGEIPIDRVNFASRELNRRLNRRTPPPPPPVEPIKSSIPLLPLLEGKQLDLGI